MTVGSIISFLTDYGQEDEFVGIVHRVIAGIGLELRVIDISHQIPRHDVRAGALMLWRSAPWLAPGVILGVVDPGVGTNRRAVAFEVAEAGTAFVGPDNGLLLPAASRLGSISVAVELGGGERTGGGPAAAGAAGAGAGPGSAAAAAAGPGSAAGAAAAAAPGSVTAAAAPGSAPAGLNPPIGATFAGRDIFAPAAARLATGAPIHTLGQAIDPATLVGHPVPPPRPAVRNGSPGVLAEVLWVDHFGNTQLNAGPADVIGLGSAPAVQVADRTWACRIVDAYGELPPGELGLVVDSYGLLSISLNGASAAELVGVAAGAAIWLSRPGPGSG